MTRPIPAPLLAALTANPRKVAEVLVIEARDGTRLGFTTWSEALSIDLGLGAGAESCGRGMVLSAVTLSVGLDASFAEVSGPLDDAITRAGVEAGRWTDAKGWLARVSPGVAGIAPLLAGRLREVRIEENRWVGELRNQADALNQALEEQVIAYCKHRFGDPDTCRFSVVPLAATVAAVTDALRFTVSYSGTQPSGKFNLGEIEFLTGDLAGVVAENVFAFTSLGAGSGSLVLDVPLIQAPEVGDTLELRQGCAKIRKSDDAAVPTCLTYGNVINFGGFPDVPGRDVLLYPNPGGT